MTTRRRFIKQSLLASGGILLSGTSFGKFFIGEKPKVIIIGAGFAGLAAAYTLKQKGIDFVILESRNRVSGRVFSHKMTDNLTIELGAEWVGESHHIVRKLCDEFNLELFNNQFDTRLIYQGKYYDKGKWDYSEAWTKKYDQLLKDYAHFSDDDKKQLDQYDWWRYLVNNGCDGRDLDIRELLDSTDFGESCRHVSAYGALDEYATSSPKNEMDLKIRGGNGMLGEALANKVGMENILLKHTVERIVQDDKVTVYCDNGKTFTGDKIICTTPTFALKKIKWEPALSVEHALATNELQYARINKNPLLFSDRFWKDESFDLVTDTSTHYFYHATKNQKDKKGILISYTIGDKAAVAGSQDEAYRTAMMQQTLSPYFGDVKKKLEKQTNYYWGNDAYSKGSYAIFKPGQWFRVQPALRAPHVHTLFAGEHLAESWQGFMEGALMTGMEAANALI
jgi:monoamine oxidase